MAINLLGADLEEGMLVGILGVQHSPGLNGTVGVIYGFDKASQRYVVHVEDGSSKNFKMCNLVLEGEVHVEKDEDYSESFTSGWAGLDDVLLSSTSMSAPMRH